MAEAAETAVETLSRENETAQRLLESLAEDGQALRSGAAVEPGRFAEGIRLLAQLRGLHVRRLRRDLEPEARLVAMSTCFEHLDGIAREQQDSEERLRGVQRAVEEYGRGLPGARERLVTALEVLSEREYEAISHENDYPLSCLATALPESADGRVRAALGTTDHEVADLQRHVERYVAGAGESEASELSVRCRFPACSATGQARLAPGSGGYLAVQGPAGWRAVPGSPRPAAANRVAVELEFYCPAHAPSRSEGRPPRSPADASCGCAPRTGPSAPTPAALPCCNPIPLELA